MNGDESAEGLLTGQHGVDREHRFQLELLTTFARALEDGRGDAAFDEILDRLIEYTKVHFSSEELLMRLYQYPRYQEHVADHERIVERLEDLHRARLAGGEVSARAAAWISAHIRGADRALGHFFARLGIGAG